MAELSEPAYSLQYKIKDTENKSLTRTINAVNWAGGTGTGIDATQAQTLAQALASLSGGVYESCSRIDKRNII